MNVNLLIDNVVRQTTVLVAQLATAAGRRAPLSRVASQVFGELVSELKSQGLGNEIIADMFGLTLRTYHDRVRRAAESRTDRGQSLWEAVLRYARTQPVVARGELLRRFRADDEASVRGVLSDLVDGGLLFRSGRGDLTTYRAATDEEARAVLADDGEASEATMIWVALHQAGPASVEELARRLSLSPEQTRAQLERLVLEGRAQSEEGGTRFRSDHCVIPHGDEIGWEAAVFDHFQAVVTAIAGKLTRGATRSRANESVGGSTYHFDLYPGHPREAEVLGLLEAARARASALRAQMEGDEPVAESAGGYRVVFYLGQNVIGAEPAEGEAT